MLRSAVVVCHVVRHDASAWVELIANTRAGRTLLVRGLSGDRDRASASGRTGMRVAMPRGRTVPSRGTNVAVPVDGSRGTLHGGACTTRHRREWLGTRAATLCSDARLPALRAEGATADTCRFSSRDRHAVRPAVRAADRLALAGKRLLIVSKHVLDRHRRASGRVL